MDDLYFVERDGHRSTSKATQADVDGFLDACGIEKDSQEWYAALAGAPIEVDNSVMCFVHIEGCTKI